mgnify:CR=1 FL=1
MKKQMKSIILTVATLFLGISSVSAATININLSDGTKKTYEIKESEYDKTIYDFKKSIEKDVGIDADYQVLEMLPDNYPESDSVKLKDHFASSYGISVSELNYNLLKREELEGDTLTLYSIPPVLNDNNSAYAILEGAVMGYYHGYEAWSSECNETITKCKIRLASNHQLYKEMNIKYVYDAKIASNVKNLVEKVKTAGKVGQEDFYRFQIEDLELVNYWLNGGSMINYSDVYKKSLDYKNFYLDIRAGDEQPLYDIMYGIGLYKLDNTIYGAIGDIGSESYHVLYVPDNTKDEDILSYLQKRIDEYVGKNKVILSILPELDSNNIEFIDENHENMSCDGRIYVATINNENHYFIVGKDTSKMINPKIVSSDFKTDVIVSFTDGTKPLDTMIEVDNLTSGDIYNKIMKILNVTNSETFDISLFAKSINKYITKLEDGSFEVRIPIKESLQGKNLVVYYVDENNNKEEYEVTIENGYAVFNTNHFSIYTLAEKPITNNEVIKNPETSDKIIYDFIIGVTSILGIALTIKLLKK